MAGLHKRTGKILLMPQIPSRTSPSWGKLSSEMFFPSHRNFHHIKNVPFSRLRLTETSRSFPEHQRGDLSEGEPRLRRSGTLQVGESLGRTPRCLDQGPLHSSCCSCWGTQRCLGMVCQCLTVLGARRVPSISPQKRGLLPEPCAPQPSGRCTGMRFGRVNTSRCVRSPVSFLSLFHFLEHFSLKI